MTHPKFKNLGKNGENSGTSNPSKLNWKGNHSETQLVMEPTGWVFGAVTQTLFGMLTAWI